MFRFQYNTPFSGVSTPKTVSKAAETVLWDNDWRFHAGAQLRGIIKGIIRGINWGIIKGITMGRSESFRNRKGSFFMPEFTYRFPGNPYRFPLPTGRKIGRSKNGSPSDNGTKSPAVSRGKMPEKGQLSNNPI